MGVKSALVIGACQDIGWQLTQGLTENDFQVFAVDGDRQRLEQLADDCKKPPVLVNLRVGNLPDIEPAVAAMAERIIGETKEFDKVSAGDSAGDSAGGLEMVIFAQEPVVDLTRIVDLSPRDFAAAFNVSVVSCQLFLAAAEGLLRQAEMPRVIWLTRNRAPAFHGMHLMMDAARRAMAAAYYHEHRNQPRAAGVIEIGNDSGTTATDAGGDGNVWRQVEPWISSLRAASLGRLKLTSEKLTGSEVQG